MHFRKWFTAIVLCVAFFASVSYAVNYPVRGMSMSSVRAQCGEPHTIQTSKGQVKAKWPRITIWNYGSFSVYFEHGKVLHTVVHQGQ